jgi:hypothetical protein
MSYETLEPPRSDDPSEGPLPGGSAEVPHPDGPAEPPRADPQIFVEAVPNAGAEGWTEPVLTRTERHRCPHWVRYADLNAKGRIRRMLAALAIWMSWAVIVTGLFVGLASVAEGLEADGELAAIGGLAIIGGLVVQAVSTVSLTMVWRRMHPPSDLTIVLGVNGYLLLLIGLGLFLAIADSLFPVAAVAAMPYAYILGQLIAFRNELYPRETCRTYPGLPPAIHALLKDQYRTGSARFQAADCPHRVEFSALRPRYRVASVVNFFLCLGYYGVVGFLWLAQWSPPVSFSGDEAVGHVLVVLLPVGNLFALGELHARSKRYHRAGETVYIGAFVGYATTLAAGLWAGLGMYTSLVVIALTIYWAYSAAYAMKHLPPRSECASMTEPPPAIQKMLKA